MTAVLMAATIMAQDAQVTAQPTNAKPILLERSGNTYFYGNQKMNKTQMLDWYAQHNCQVAYNQFRSGYKVATAGWICLGLGLAFDISGLGCIIAGAPKAGASADPANLPSLYKAGLGLAWVGGALEIASIPCLIVGYVRMHRSVDTYNVDKAYNRPQAYWSLQTGNTGIGLALHF